MLKISRCFERICWYLPFGQIGSEQGVGLWKLRPCLRFCAIPLGKPPEGVGVVSYQEKDWKKSRGHAKVTFVREAIPYWVERHQIIRHCVIGLVIRRWAQPHEYHTAPNNRTSLTNKKKNLKWRWPVQTSSEYKTGYVKFYWTLWEFVSII